MPMCGRRPAPVRDLLGRHEGLLALRDALVQAETVDGLLVEWNVDLGPGAHPNAGRAEGVRPSDELPIDVRRIPL